MNQPPSFDDRRSRFHWDAPLTVPATPPPLQRGRAEAVPELEAAHFTRAPREKSLTPLAHGWLLNLPPHYQPLSTARQHPHIVNRLSALWQQPEALAAYFDALLKTQRQRRGGFSLGVLTELTDLLAGLETLRLDAAAAEAALNEQQHFIRQTKQKAASSGERLVDQRR